MPPRIKLGYHLTRAVRVLEDAGYSKASAELIAQTHAVADALGLSIEWQPDPDGELSAGDDEGQGKQWWGVIARGTDGEVLDSLWGIDLGETGPDAHHSIPYQWDAEAQVLDEAIVQIKDVPSYGVNPGSHVNRRTAWRKKG